MAVVGACINVLYQTLRNDGAPLAASVAFSGLAFALSFALIRWLGAAFMKVGFKGKDMSKVKKTEMCVVHSLGARSKKHKALQEADDFVCIDQRPWARFAQWSIFSS